MSGWRKERRGRKGSSAPLRVALALALAVMAATALFAAQGATAVIATTGAPQQSVSEAQIIQRFLNSAIDRLDGDRAGASLKQWRGKVLVVNFWASWCGPCQYEIPRFKAWQGKYGADGLQIVGVGVDARNKLKNVARSLGVDYPLLIMPPAQSRPLLAALGDKQMIMPFTVIIDRSGKIAGRHKGLLGQDEFDIIIAPLLQSDRASAR